MNFPFSWTVLVPPVAGTIIGYFTNDIAIRMLFRPYYPKYLFGQRIPFTPGLIPRNQERLAKRVSDTIMGSLLTPEALEEVTKNLLARERLTVAIRWLLTLALDQVQRDQNRKSNEILANILRDLSSESLPRLLKVWARRDGFLKKQVDQIFDQVLLDFQLTSDQARQLGNWILDDLLPPDMLRLGLIEFLSDRNIQVIDQSFRDKSSGTYWVIANLFGLSNTLVKLRSFCLEERAMANARLKEILLSLEVRNKLRTWLQGLSLQNLPVSTVRQLRHTLHRAVQDYFQTQGSALVSNLGKTINWDKFADLIINRLQNSSVLDSSLDLVSQEFAIILERYLERDLTRLVAQVIPILALDQLIIDRIRATAPADLEEATQSIVRSELQAIVNLGGVLGFIVGAMQTLFLLNQS